jgi:hypothetical protein
MDGNAKSHVRESFRTITMGGSLSFQTTRSQDMPVTKHGPDFEILGASLETSNNMELPGTYA